ncbi:MAG: efflux transporter outer membrane subunit [Leptothrix sp. (in: b-proteobacteria)]
MTPRPARGLLRPILSSLLLSLSACALPPPATSAAPDSRVEVPPAWSDAEAAAPTGEATSLAQWWRRFDDPLLSQLVEQALQANTSVKSAQAALQQARALRDVAAAGLWPQAGVSASVQRSRSGSNAATHSVNAGLDASWQPDLFGANRSALDSSEATARASAASLGNVQVAIAAEVCLSYITLRSAQTRLAIANDNLISQQETLQLTEWRQQAGLVTELETEQARAATEQTRAQLPALQTSLEQTAHALAVLSGQPPAALASLLAAASPVPQASDVLELSLPAETLRQRPDVQAAEHQISAALARVAQADAARAPSFKLSGSLGLSALTLGAASGGATLVSTLLASVSMPLFDGGAASAQVRAQQAALDQARVAYQAAALTALKDVEDALVALRGDRERLLRLQNAAQAASNAALLARQRYRSGLVDFQTVLDTQRSQLGTQDSVASASADLSADHVRLYQALGGGWHPDSNPATSARTDAAARTAPQ